MRNVHHREKKPQFCDVAAPRQTPFFVALPPGGADMRCRHAGAFDSPGTRSMVRALLSLKWQNEGIDQGQSAGLFTSPRFTGLPCMVSSFSNCFFSLQTLSHRNVS